jgi:energy-coupling factor transport system ATP-binding protein
MNEGPAFETQDLAFTYNHDSRPTLSNVNVRIRKHGWTLLIGDSGAGKSTFLRLIKGLLVPSSGRVKHATDIQPRQIGLLSGDPYNFSVGVTVEEDIAFGLENLNVPRNRMREIIRESLENVGLEGVEKRLVRDLSGGEQQKLALACLIAMDTRVFLLDETFGMLDRPGRNKIRRILMSISHSHQGAVIEVVDNLDFTDYADRLLFMEKGVFSFDGAPADFFASDAGRAWIAGIPSSASVRLELSRLGRRGPKWDSQALIAKLASINK